LLVKISDVRFINNEHITTRRKTPAVNKVDIESIKILVVVLIVVSIGQRTVFGQKVKAIVAHTAPVVAHPQVQGHVCREAVLAGKACFDGSNVTLTHVHFRIGTDVSPVDVANFILLPPTKNTGVEAQPITDPKARIDVKVEVRPISTLITITVEICRKTDGLAVVRTHPATDVTLARITQKTALYARFKIVELIGEARFQPEVDIPEVLSLPINPDFRFCTGEFIGFIKPAVF
jgi:hypothetical protein